MNLFNRYKIIIARLFFSVFWILVLGSCAPTRRLAEDEKLFVKSSIKTDQKDVDTRTLRKYERLSPNKKVLGLRAHLFLYSMANPEKEKGLSGWLKKIGEPPVIYDSTLLNQSCDNMITYLNTRGYVNASLTTDVHEHKKKVRAKYDIIAGEPVTIERIAYQLEDTSISRYIYSDTIHSLLHKGDNFDKVMMQYERERIERNLKNEGFFRFTKEYIYYEVKPTNDPMKVDVEIHIKQNMSGVYDPVNKIRKHIRYHINSVQITPNVKKIQDHTIIDSVYFMDHRLLYADKVSIKPQILVGANNLLPGSLYRLDDVDKTYLDYSTLGLFRYINVSFDELPEKDGEGQLACNIDLSMRKRQSYSFELTVTNSSYDFGVRGGISYNNYNLFRGGEHFQIGVSGAIEKLEHRLGSSDPMKEFGISTSLETPKFILPFNAVDFQRKYKPRTIFSLSYNDQNQPKYKRTIVNTSYGYNWKGNALNKHSFYPIDFYLVKLPWIDSAYIDSTYGGTRLENSFVNHTILGLRYSFEFNNRKIKVGNSFIYLIYNFEAAGLLVNEINKRVDTGVDSLFFGVEFFQYIRNDIDFRNYFIITPRNRLVYRLFAGVGLPYGNSSSMPFEKMYWSGGPYGIRAWGERTLGPGPYVTESSYNQLGEVKLEANFEYRFKLISKVEGALFADAGNIWLLEDTEGYPGSGFSFDRFYKDIAMGVGFGVRFDFSFVLLRLDVGFKLHDPSITEGNRWTLNNPNANFWDPTVQFGIGYPF